MTKQDLLKMVQALPENAPFDKIAAEVEKARFIAQVQEGLDDVARGNVIPHEEVMEEMEQWLKEKT